eukprot:CAMPEP_0175078208 /NCGR_PEP_ID=MMETSP0052_2-20121109/23953_1 /TAXON_ID=51329 ORGANISM="Polytomella parva, Strain SAG 63-3" /NCGR_SAMPLE_ID=MMETSP0052_2 /ASSEMBLY_ACC=CAM_ASM_000194 /LENGTH=319 /DNA_ID=CAMNT_0016348029 /DNA_START=455 /DNA_END=1412 /DNA_ORIENTATION=-
MGWLNTAALEAAKREKDEEEKKEEGRFADGGVGGSGKLDGESPLAVEEETALEPGGGERDGEREGEREGEALAGWGDVLLDELLEAEATETERHPQGASKEARKGEDEATEGERRRRNGAKNSENLKQPTTHSSGKNPDPKSTSARITAPPPPASNARHSSSSAPADGPPPHLHPRIAPQNSISKGGVTNAHGNFRPGHGDKTQGPRPLSLLKSTSAKSTSDAANSKAVAPPHPSIDLRGVPYPLPEVTHHHRKITRHYVVHPHNHCRSEVLAAAVEVVQDIVAAERKAGGLARLASSRDQRQRRLVSSLGLAERGVKR